ncbi:BnaC03g44360D [Brassica napus]|uniref:Nudix hydrolase n=1 Tax=Brassica napus TaxID=3708 RepID=A0A078FKV2_BRANA|nr:BnaC03g44360D [Brassica napus]
MDCRAHQIFSGKEDNYGGVVVNLMEMEPTTAQDFESKLDVSLAPWKVQGKRGIWIKLSSQLSSLVDSAIKRGFTYHHAENEYVVLTSWISESPSTIPANASHRIGIGAFVLNKSRDVLLPTVISTTGEDIWTGAVGEVEEETCIKTKFVEVLAFRERHQSFFERKSSVFFFCELEASNFEIKKQDSEILDAIRLLKVFKEYVNQPFNQKKEMLRFMANICLKRSHGKENYAGFSTVLTKNSAAKESYLYCSVDHADILNGKCDQACTSFFTTLFHKCFCFT